MEITFTTDNQAFEEHGGVECARILREIATKVERGHRSGSIFDFNGNKIGMWHYPVAEDEL